MFSSIHTIRDHTFYTSSLGAQSVILDLGANSGEFSREMIRRFGCTCYAVEALPSLWEQIPEMPRLHKFNFALSGANEEVTFHISPYHDASTLLPTPIDEYTGTIRVPARTLESFVRELGLASIDLVKMDIEGAEIAVLDACPDEILKRAAQYTIEFHVFNGSVPRADAARVVERFRGLGYDVYERTWQSYFDVLLIDRERVGLSDAEFLWANHVVRYARGAGRRLRRAIAG